MFGVLMLGVVAAVPEPVAVEAPPAGWQVSSASATVRGSVPLPAEPDDAETTDDGVPLEVWQRLADCESGDWSRHGEPKPDTARWDYGLEFDHGDHFEGGLNFHPETWDDFRDPDMPEHAGEASRATEIEVAERVLEEQGWDAWPVCSEVVGVDT